MPGGSGQNSMMGNKNFQKNLDPAGIGGSGGMDKGSTVAFFDPMGIDAGPNGMHVFGNDTAGMGGNTVPSSLPNFGIKPQFYDPNSFVSRPSGNGSFNAMAANLAGPMYDPRLLQTPAPIKKPNVGQIGGREPMTPNTRVGVGANPSIPAGAGNIGSLLRMLQQLSTTTINQ